MPSGSVLIESQSSSKIQGLIDRLQGGRTPNNLDQSIDAIRRKPFLTNDPSVRQMGLGGSAAYTTAKQTMQGTKVY